MFGLFTPEFLSYYFIICDFIIQSLLLHFINTFHHFLLFHYPETFYPPHAINKIQLFK